MVDRFNLLVVQAARRYSFAQIEPVVFGLLDLVKRFSVTVSVKHTVHVVIIIIVIISIVLVIVQISDRNVHICYFLLNLNISLEPFPWRTHVIIGCELLIARFNPSWVVLMQLRTCDRFHPIIIILAIRLFIIVIRTRVLRLRIRIQIIVIDMVFQVFTGVFQLIE